MANEDFHKVVRKNVEFIWPRLDQTYRYNSQAKKTEPCAPTVQQAAWSIGFLLPMAEAQALKAELQQHYEACASRNNLPVFDKVFGAKVYHDKDGNATDMVQFTADRKGVANSGEPNKPPQVVGRDQQPLADLAIWGGSKGHIRVYAVPTTDPDGIGGIKLLLNAVQVTEPVYGGDNLADDFGEPEPDFGDEEETPNAATAAQANASTHTPAHQPSGGGF